MKTNTELEPFATKEALIEGYARSLATEASFHDREGFRDALEVSRLTARSSAKYVAHIYKGGWVIVGFGFSTERIGNYGVTPENCGNPELVEAR